MTATTLDTAARITRITARHLRRRRMVIGDMGDTEDMGDMVGTEVIPSGLPQRRVLDRLRCVLARPLNPQEGGVFLRGGQSGYPLTKPSHRTGDQRQAGDLPAGAVVLAKAVAARNSGLWYTIRRGRSGCCRTRCPGAEMKPVNLNRVMPAKGC